MRKLSALPGGGTCLSLLALLCLMLTGCRRDTASISFREVPPVSVGGPQSQGILAGQISRFKPGERMLLYSKSGGRWWIQPLAHEPYTEIKPDGSWSAAIHLGMSYAAVLTTGEAPQKKVLEELPKAGGDVVAVATVDGKQVLLAADPPKILHFGGYDWEVKSGNGGFGGKSHNYAAENVWLDEHGAMHLRLSQVAEQWVCAETHIVRTLGYGSYRWRIRDVYHLEPAAMLSLFTWAVQPEQHHREIDVHVSRWGDPISKSGEYVIQPYYLPANVYRFNIPPGPVEESFRWAPGRVDFTTYAARGKAMEPWTFTSGVPASSDENASVNLCEFGYAKRPLQHETEVVIEQFEFLP